MIVHSVSVCVCTYTCKCVCVCVCVASLTKLKDETESDVAKKGLLSSLVHSEVSILCSTTFKCSTNVHL